MLRLILPASITADYNNIDKLAPPLAMLVPYGSCSTVALLHGSNAMSRSICWLLISCGNTYQRHRHFVRAGWYAFCLVLVWVCGGSGWAQDKTSLSVSRETLQSRYENASRLYTEKRWHDAAEEFRWLASQAPNTLLGSYATVYEAECLAEERDIERATALLLNWLGANAERVAAELPKDNGALNGSVSSAEGLLVDRARLRLADLALRAGNSELAIANFTILSQSALTKETQGRALLALGRYFQSQSDPQQALGYFRKISSDAEYSIFQPAAKLGELSIRLASDPTEDVLKELSSLAETTGDDGVSSAAAMQLAQHFYQGSKFAEALDFYRQAEHGAGDSFQLPLIRLGQVNSLYQLGRKEEARKLLGAYLEDFPQDGNWTQQAYQYIRWQLAANDFNSAQQWLDRLHEIGFNTEQEEVAWLKAKALYGRVSHNFPAAIDALRSATALVSVDEKFDLRKELLAVMIEAGEGKAALVDLADWVSEYKSLQQSESQAFFEVKQLELLAQGRHWDQVGPAVAAWLTENPSHAQLAEVLLVKAQFEIGTVRIDDARATLSHEIFKVDTTADRLKAQSQWLVGETYFLQKDYVAAVAAYSSVVRTSQDSKWKSLAMLQAGKCYEIVGQANDAKQLYEEAIKITPSPSVKKQLELRLAEIGQTRTSSLTPASENTIPSR
jgi:tetratricopeptide (TPR) repeat protein